MIFDNMKNCALYYGANKNFEKAFDFIKYAVSENLPVGKYELDSTQVYASVQEYETKLPENGKFEGHRNYIDIQYVVSGAEAIDVMDVGKAVAKTEYDPVKDFQLYENSENCNKCAIEAGEYGIFFPHDIHKPGMAYGEIAPVKKIVVKVKA